MKSFIFHGFKAREIEVLSVTLHICFTDSSIRTSLDQHKKYDKHM